MTMQNVAIGVDVGGTKILCGLVSEDGKVLRSEQRPTRPESLLEDICTAAEGAREQARALGREVLGAGVAIKGFIDPQAGVLIRSMSLGVHDLPIARKLSQRLSLPVRIENDVHAATVGEMRHGLGSRHNTMIVFNAGTGISAGLVADGKLLRGGSGMAGEIGHMVVDAGFPHACKCGRYGCLEDLILRHRRGEPIELAEGTHQDGLTPDYVLLALGIANLVNTLNPTAIALVGGMFLKNTAVIPAFAVAVRSSCLASAGSALGDIRPAAGGYEAGLLGAGTLPFLQVDPIYA